MGRVSREGRVPRCAVTKGDWIPMSLILCAIPSCLCLVGVSATGAANAPIPVILDTDIGSDIDDTWALGMLLGHPEIDLKLIVTAFEDTSRKTRLVAKMLERMGRTDVPLGMGVKTKDESTNQDKWLGDYALDGYKGKVHADGVQAMIDALMGSKEKVTLVVIGPQTNIREALRREPKIAEKARVVSMAGSVHIGYGGKQGRDPEWNVKADVEAARAVFAAPWEITITPLDTCGTIILRGDRYAKVRDAKENRAVVVMENYRDWTNRKHYPENESSVLFDTVAAYLAFDEKLVQMETVKLTIDDAGNTVPSDAGRPVRCALSWKDREAFEDLLVDSLVKATMSTKK